MTIAVQDKDAIFAQHVTVAREQHKRLLRKLTPINEHVRDLVALLWLPGRSQTFDNPVRTVHEMDRPVLVTLEVTADADLRFCGAISRFRNGELVFKPVFSYDAVLPLTYSTSGSPALCAKNLSLVRRLNDLLSELISVGRAISRRGQSSSATEPTWPAVICDKHGKVFEDYTLCLGMPTENPARGVTSVPVPDVGETVVTPLNDALRTHEAFTLEWLRGRVSAKFSRDVTYRDLLRAAHDPQRDLNISRRSRIQICPVAAVQDLPVGYAGTVLAPVDWAPPIRDVF